MVSAPQSFKKTISLNGTEFKLGTEKAVGEAIKASGIPREEIFVTTKLP
jgi:diketogulonate reductase-like aldo/keto reductase